MRSDTIQLTMSASAMTSTNTLTSTSTPLDQAVGCAIQVVWTGTPNGTFKLQASDDKPSRQTQTSSGGPDTITNWTDITDSSYTIAGTAGDYMWNITDVMYRNIRLVYTNTSGTGTLTVAQIVVKGV